MFSRKFFSAIVGVVFAMLFTLQATADEVVKLHGPIIQEENVIISWLVNCDAPQAPEEVVIRYNRSVVLANKGEIWKYTDPAPYLAGHLELNNLNPSNAYVYQLGYLKSPGLDKVPENYIWSSRQRFETKMPWGATRFLFLIGALSLFIFGMKTM